jgi:pimeloyl-[acyl-carrier protein] methyl ester esterase
VPLSEARVPLVLLPGLDGTGEQFEPLLSEPCRSVEPRVVCYPRDRALDYDALLLLVREQLPVEPFVLLGESFSGPLAIRLAAEKPPGLRALVLVASFHRRPVSPWLAGLRPLVRDVVFAVPPPSLVVRRLLAGADAPDAIVESFRASARSVRADVLAGRVRAALDVDVSARLAEIEVPITYLAAEDDALVRRAIPDELRAIVPSLEVQRLRAPHLLLQRRPREAVEVIESLVDRVRVAR